MKVLIVNSLYHPNVIGGAEKLVRVLAESLVEARLDVVVVSLGPDSGTEPAVINGVRVYYVGLKNLYWPFGPKGNPLLLKPFWHAWDAYNIPMAAVLGRLLDSEHPDVVHTHNLAGFSVACWREVKRRGLPLVHTLHDCYLLCPNSMMFDGQKNCHAQCLKCCLFSIPKKRLSNLVDAVVGPSRYILDRHLRADYFRKARLKRVVRNACNYSEHLIGQKRIGQEPIHFGYLGRLHPSKGVEWLLQNLRLLPQEGWELWIAGKGTEEYDRYLRHAYSSPRFHFMGFVRPEELFARIDVLIVPSLWNDTFPSVVLEAYAHGIPVIGSNRGGIPEMIDEGQTGFVFDPSLPESLVKACHCFVNDPGRARKMCPQVFQKAREFSPSTLSRDHLSLYKGVSGAWMPPTGPDWD